MQLSLLPVSYFPALQSGEMPLKEWARLGKSLGLDAVDLGIVLLKNHTPVYTQQVVDELSEVGIGIGMITDYPDFTNPDPLQREREMDYLRRDIALASRVGARLLRVTAGQHHPGVPVADQTTWAAECLAKMGDVGTHYGVELVVENHSKPGAWHYYDLTYDPEVFVDLVRRLASTPIGVNFDTANTVAAGHDPVPVLEEVADQVISVHAADTESKGNFKPVVVGTGAVPFPELFAVLRRRGFDNWICIEEWSNTGEDGIKRAVENVRKLWRQSDT